MQQYLDMVRHILAHGEERVDRTGVGTIGIFGYQARYDLRQGFPLLTTKKLHWKSIVEELLWMLRGETNSKILEAKGVTIWKEWAREDGDLGPVYGHQWRYWNAPLTTGYGRDQLRELITQIKTQPYSRRHILTAWNPDDIEYCALPPCHVMAQFYVSNNNELSCQMYQRSMDAFLGAPYNIASYSLLTHIFAHMLGYQVGEFIHSIGDAHIYKNHLTQVELQLTREPLVLPTLRIKRLVADPAEYMFEDFELLNYTAHPHIKAEVAV